MFSIVFPTAASSAEPQVRWTCIVNQSHMLTGEIPPSPVTRPPGHQLRSKCLLFCYDAHAPSTCFRQKVSSKLACIAVAVGAAAKHEVQPLCKAGGHSPATPTLPYTDVLLACFSIAEDTGNSTHHDQENAPATAAASPTQPSAAAALEGRPSQSLQASSAVPGWAAPAAAAASLENYPKSLVAAGAAALPPHHQGV